MSSCSIAWPKSGLTLRRRLGSSIAVSASLLMERLAGHTPAERNRSNFKYGLTLGRDGSSIYFEEWVWILRNHGKSDVGFVHYEMEIDSVTGASLVIMKNDAYTRYPSLQLISTYQKRLDGMSIGGFAATRFAHCLRLYRQRWLRLRKLYKQLLVLSRLSHLDLPWQLLVQTGFCKRRGGQ